MTLLLNCPWCDSPLEMPEDGLDRMRCSDCGTLLDLAPDPPPVRMLRRSEPLPDAA